MRKLFFPLMLVFVFTGGHCKKDKPSKFDCDLIVLTPETGAVNNLYYDDQGRLILRKVENISIQYVYKGDSVIVTEKNGYTFSSRRRYRLNAQGLPVVMRLDINESGTQWWQYDFEYNGTELKKSVESFYANIPTTVIEYTWNNGNLTGFKTGQWSWKFEYFEDKPRIAGDGFYLQSLSTSNVLLKPVLGPVEIIRNKNLLRSWSETLQNVGTGILAFEYAFDNSGKIDNILANENNGLKQFRYYCQYRCN